MRVAVPILMSMAGKRLPSGCGHADAEGHVYRSQSGGKGGVGRGVLGERRSRRARTDSIATGYVLSRALIGSVITLLVIFAVAQTAARLHLITSTYGPWAPDFRGGLWPAARAVLNGSSPYARPNASILFALKNSFVWPPTLAVIAMPLAHLPFSLAIALWNVTCTAALIGGLWLLEVRDWRMYVLSVCSYPFVESLYMGQPEGIFVLLLAVGWRYRDALAGPVSVGALIAAKLLAWPLLVWLLFTRRLRATAVATLTAAALVLGSWALIDFHGLLQYPRLLAADSRAFEGYTFSMSAVGLAMHFGAHQFTATAAAWLLGLGAGLLTVACSQRSDAGWFSGALVTGLLVSPLLWTHYLLVLFVPLAITRRNSIAPWLLTSVFWVWIITYDQVARAAVTIAGAIAISAWSAMGSAAQRREPARSPNGMGSRIRSVADHS